MTATTANTPATAAGLRVAASTTVGPRRLVVTLEVAPGDVVALVGPNGAGKSTALELVLGLRRASDGRITLDHRVLDDGDHHVPPGERGLGWAPQAPGLLPRRSVARQVTTFARPDHAPLLRDGTVADLLDALLLGHLSERRPDGLSGGEAQRVAVARALAHARVVLLDEPTSAQDPEGAAAVRRAVRAHAAAGGSAVVVSHRPQDAWLVADRATVMEDLRTIQHGTPEQLAAAPASSHVARLVGLTVLRGEVGHDHVLRSADGDLVVGDHVAPGPAVATLRAEAVTLHRSRPPASSARNVVPGVIARLDHTAAGVRVHVDGSPALVATLTAEAVAELDLRPGVAVWASCKASEVHVHGA